MVMVMVMIIIMVMIIVMIIVMIMIMIMIDIVNSEEHSSPFILLYRAPAAVVYISTLLLL